MMSHTSFPGSFNWITLTAIRRCHTGHNKSRSARRKVERLEELEKIGTEDTEVKNTDTNVGNGQMLFLSEANSQKITIGLNDVIRSDTDAEWGTMDTFDRTWQGTEPLLLKADTAIPTKGSFPPDSDFSANTWSTYDEVTWIEIPYPALFPLPISHPIPKKKKRNSRSHSQLKFLLPALVFG